MSLRAPNWDTDGRDWPNRTSSRFVEAGGLRWHVQLLGAGPLVLLLHGTGASTHSWRDVAPQLARTFHVVAVDLPGHGFSEATSDWTLPGMVAALASLLRALAVDVQVVVGHSAGAAIALYAIMRGAFEPRAFVSFNGAFVPFGGRLEPLLSPAARVLSWRALPRIVSARARQGGVERIVAGTGSRLDARGLELYQRLIERPAHVASSLSMMAHWNLRLLDGGFALVQTPALFVAASHDRAVPPHQAREVAARLPRGRVHVMAGLGHLAHEEAPNQAGELVCGLWNEVAP